MTPGLFRTRKKSVFRLRTNNTPEPTETRVEFGEDDDMPVTGDWDGNGTTTVGVYRPSTLTFLLRNTNAAGEPDVSIPFGKAGDIPLTGNWDGQ